MAREKIIATFLGYQASGKTTFLAAVQLASSLGRVSFTATESVRLTSFINKESNSQEYTMGYWNKRIKELRVGEQVLKTKIGFPVEFTFDFTIGKRKLQVHTIDYPGELADGANQESETKVLYNLISKSHSLFVFLDASLLSNTVGQEERIEREIGQGTAIDKAINHFLEFRSGYPIVVLVTKADLLFRGRSSSEIAGEIYDLNEDNDKAKAFFLERFGQAPNILRNKILKICFVAALGPNPESSTTRNAESSEGFVIRDLNKWKPLGLSEPLSAGFSGALGKKKLSGSIKKGKILFRYIAPVALLFLASFLFDTRAFRKLKESHESFEKGQVGPAEVLNKATEAGKWWHPFNTIPGSTILIGTIPETARSIEIKSFKHEFAVKKYKQDVQELAEKSESLPKAINISVDSFPDINMKIQDLVLAWNDQREQLKDLIDNTQDPILKHEIDTNMRNVTISAIYAFYVKAIKITWESAREHAIPEELIQQVAKPLREALYDIYKHDSSRKSDDIYHQALSEYEKGQCRYTAETFLLALKDDSLNDQLKIERMVAIQQMCEDDEIIDSVAEKLINYADAWDMEEAKLIYEIYPFNNDGSGATLELKNKFEKYRKNTKKRDRIGFASRYKRHADDFFRWITSLNRTYSINGISINIPRDHSIISSHTESYEVSDGWKKRTKYRTIYDNPDGLLTISIDGKEVYQSTFDNFTNSNKKVARFGWKPGQVLVVKIYNKLSKKSVNIAFEEYFYLLKLKDQDISHTGITINVKGLSFPSMQPSSLPKPLEVISD